MDIKLRFYQLRENTVFLSKIKRHIRVNYDGNHGMPTYLLATQKLMNIKKKKKQKKKSKHDFRVLAILDKLQSTIRYQLPWLKIYNIWLLLSSLFFDVSSAVWSKLAWGAP